MGGGGSFDSRFPSLSILDKKKSCFVSERILPNEFKWAWKRNPSSDQELADINSLSGLISNVVTSHGLDQWISLLSGDGVFHVRELRCLIDSKITSPMVNPTVWFHIPPLKVICFVWRACIDRIPTVMALFKRGVRVGTNSCHLCSSGVDDTDHLFTGCSFAGDIWKWLCHWCGIPFRSFNNVSSLVEFAANWGHCPKKKRIFLVIVYGFLWCIWKARNEKVFRSTCANAPKVVDNILALVFDWVKHRGKFNNCNWYVWVCNPFDIL